MSEEEKENYLKELENKFQQTKLREMESLNKLLNYSKLLFQYLISMKKNFRDWFKVS